MPIGKELYYGAMKSQKEGYGYNERLFSGGLRRKLHLARFKWFLAEVQRRKCSADAVLELGCFDGKLIDFLPHKPQRYVGFDANWEGGLDMARKKWAGVSNYVFCQVSSPQEMILNDSDIFTVAVAMETLEHVPPTAVDGYLAKIAQHLDGYFFVTVPNEKGIVFLMKWLAKKLLSKDIEQYTISELANATLGRMELIDRHEHKGFDYDSLIKSMEKYFDVINVAGHPFGFMPHALCFGIGVVAKSRRK